MPPPSPTPEVLVIIDEFESIISDETKNQLFSILKAAKNIIYKNVIISRSTTFSFHNYLVGETFTLSLEGLASSEIDTLINKNFPALHQQLNRKERNELTQLLNGSPLAINLALEYLSQNKEDLPFHKVSKLITQDINYNGKLITSPSKIITPPLEIIKDVKVVNSSLIEIVRKSPNSIYNLSSRKFEEFVAELFEKEGYKVTLTKATRDGGKDLFIVEKSVLGNLLFYVECKRHSKERPVGIGIIRELLGTITHDRATAGIVITSSYFTKDARAFSETVKHQISLIDYLKINEMISTKIN